MFSHGLSLQEFLKLWFPDPLEQDEQVALRQEISSRPSQRTLSTERVHIHSTFIATLESISSPLRRNRQ